MANPVPSSNLSIPSLVTGIVEDAQGLIRQQFALLKHELREDAARVKNGSVILGAGIGVGLLGGILLTLMLVYLLHWAAPDLPLWACYGIVGGVFVAASGLLCYRGISEFKSFNPIPEQTVQAMKENFQWKTAPY